MNGQIEWLMQISDQYINEDITVSVWRCIFIFLCSAVSLAVSPSAGLNEELLEMPTSRSVSSQHSETAGSSAHRVPALLCVTRIDCNYALFLIASWSSAVVSRGSGAGLLKANLLLSNLLLSLNCFLVTTVASIVMTFLTTIPLLFRNISQVNVCLPKKNELLSYKG